MEPQEHLKTDTATENEEMPMDDIESVALIIQDMISEAMCDMRVTNCFGRLEHWVPENYIQWSKQGNRNAQVPKSALSAGLEERESDQAVEQSSQETCTRQKANVFAAHEVQPDVQNFSEFVIRNALLGILEESSNPRPESH